MHHSTTHMEQDSWHLTIEEEASILAEFGVQGPYVELIELPAASHFRSDYGDTNVFLTGAHAEGSYEEVVSPKDDTLDHLSGELGRMSLESLIVNYTNIFTTFGSSCLMTGMSDALQRLKQCSSTQNTTDELDFVAFNASINERDRVRSLPSVDNVCAHKCRTDGAYREALRAGKEAERRAAHICSGVSVEGVAKELLVGGSLPCGVPSLPHCTEDKDMTPDLDVKLTDSIAEDMTKLLMEADDVLHHRRIAPEVPENDPILCARRAEMEQEMRLFGRDALDDVMSEDEALEVVESERLLRAARAHTAKSSHDATGKGGGLGEVNDRNSEHDVIENGHTASRGFPQLEAPVLHAFELQLTNEELCSLQQWDELLMECDARPPSLEMREHINDIVDAVPLLSSETIAVDPTSSLNSTEPGRITTELPDGVMMLEHPELKAVLRSIKSIAENDVQMEMNAERILREGLRESAKRHKDPRELDQQRKMEGRLSFDLFTNRVDALIPSCMAGSRSQEPTALTIPSDSPKSSPLPKGSTVVKPFLSKLEVIKRQALVDAFLIYRESLETRLMRTEDAHQQRLVRQEEDQREEIRQALLAYLSNETPRRCALVNEEAITFQRLDEGFRRQANLVTHIIELRTIQMVTRLADDVFAQYSIAAKIIGSTEAVAFADITAYERRAREQICLDMEERQHTLARELESMRRVRRDMFVSEKRMRIVRALNVEKCIRECRPVPACVPLKMDGVEASKCFLPLSGLSGSARMNGLLQEHAQQRKWILRHHHHLSMTISALGEAERCSCMKGTGTRDSLLLSSDSTHPQGTVSPHGGRPLDERDAPLSVVPCTMVDASPTVLNSEKLSHLYMLLLQSAKHDMSYVPQYFHSLSFVLEELDAIDFASLSNFEVMGTQGVGIHRRWLAERGVRLAGFVKELDLSDNRLSTLSLGDMLLTFPNMRRLKLQRNRLRHLTCSATQLRRSVSARGVAAAQEKAAADQAQLSDLDLSDNHLTDLSAVGTYLASRLVRLCGFGNEFNNLSPIAQCLSLETLILNRNSVRQVCDLASLSLLQELNLCDNHIHSIVSLAKNNFLLRKLYLSRNPMRSLPDASHHFIFLTQLFINECQLASLESATCMWMPWLSVLHAEGNQLLDISGVSHCLRLVSLKLSFNRLESAECILPLTACKRLADLDLSGNGLYQLQIPAVTTQTVGGGGDGDSAPSMKAYVRAWLLISLPCLRELDNELVDAKEKRSAWSDVLSYYQSGALSSTTLETLVYLRHPKCFASLRGLTNRLDAALSYSSPSCAYQHLSTAICADATNTELRTRVDVEDLAHSRRFHNAELIEEQLVERLKAQGRQYLPAVHRMSTLVKEQGRAANLAGMRVALQSLQSQGDQMSSRNVHMLHPIYMQQARCHAEGRAKAIIATWLCGRVCIRRARKELACLREQHRATQGYRRDLAARKIQPVWRGAVLRARLKRIFYAKDDFWDEDSYEKVDVCSEPLEAPSVGVGSLFHKVMESTGQVPNFAVPLASQKGPRFGVDVTGGFVNSGGRAGSAPLHPAPPLAQKVGATLMVDEEGLEMTALSDDHQAPNDGGESWGMDVAAQLRKKQKKMQQVHMQFLRKQFIMDPLGVRRQQGVHKKKS